MSDTLGSIRAEVIQWLMGDMTSARFVSLLNASINDSMESLWLSMMTIALSRFMGSDAPVTFTLNQGAERVQLVSITDPANPPVTGTTAGGALPGPRNYTISYTYVTESGAETNDSPTVVQAVNANNLLTVNPPANPGDAFGWNVYIGQVNQALQNQQPLPFGAQFIEDAANGVQDYPVFQQVPPASNSTADNVSWITHLEFQTPDQIWHSWNQSDLDSMVMRRLAATLSTASQYQRYGWDLLNGRVLEFRPQAGLTFTPRYFYVAKPRRLRYDQAEIPYANISGLHEYLVSKSVSACKLGLDEYIASQQWGGKAAEAQAKILQSLAQESWAKNTRISPHMY